MPATEKATVAVVGIDIGTNYSHAVGLNQQSTIVLCQKVVTWPSGMTVRQLPPRLIGIEACVGAHQIFS